MENKNEKTAQEVPVQEQLVIILGCTIMKLSKEKISIVVHQMNHQDF